MNAKETYKIRCCIEKLKSSSTSQAYEALIGIRAYITKNKDGIKVLKENNVLKYLVQFLNKPNEKIIDMSLSILGNCCLDSACRKEAVNHGVLSPLTSVLQNIAKDSIQGRACRLIGNLAQDHQIAYELHKEGVVTALVAVLEPSSKNSSPTRQMAVRALRMLWSVEQQRENMLDCRTVSAITQLLPLDIKQREDEDLVQGAIKALTIFTHQCSETCALQVIGDGKGFQDLVALVSKSSMKSSALTCISNLCQIASCRHALGVAGAVNIMIEEVASLDEGSSSKLMLALCLLCRDAFTRHKIVSAGGLPLMLAAARSSTSTFLHPCIFQALMQFVYDEEGMQALISAGLVEVLVQKLKEVIKQYGKEHSSCKASDTASKKKNKNSKKRNASDISDLRDQSLYREEQDDKEYIQPKRRFRASSPSYQAVVQEQGKGQGYTSTSNRREISPILMRTSSPEHSPASSGYHSAGTSSSPEYYWDWCPESPNNMCISSESHSPPRRTWSSSPTPSLEMMDETHIEDDDVDYPEVYSPVCQEDSESVSDMEEEENCLCVADECFQEEDNNDKQDAANENFQSTSRTTVSAAAESGPLLVLLSRVASLGKPVMELAATSTLKVLIDYIILITRQMHRAVQILLSIIRNPEYFFFLIQHEFVLMVQTQLCQHKHTDCGICDTFQTYGSSLLSALSSVAQTGFGEGVLAHKLLKGDDSLQTLFAVSIPFVVKNQKSLKFLLLECGGLDIIFTIFENIGSSYPPEYVSTGLCLLATSLGITNPQKQNSKSSIKNSLTQMESNKASGTLTSEASEDPEDSIILKLDDGTNISSSKAALSLLSPMFEAMFRGGFRESSEKCVPIPEISSPCLSHLLEMMKIGEESPTFSTTDLPTAMELLSALNRFLIPGGDSLRKLILDKHLCPETAIYIYERSIEAGDNPLFHSLHTDALKYMLTADVNSKQRELMFKKLQDSVHKEKMIADIKTILIQNLRRSFSREFSTS